LAEWVGEFLNVKGYDVTLCHRGDEAVPLIVESQPDVVILDGELPGLDGVDVCQKVRPDYDNAIIMVTARDEELDEVLGLKMGADEYLTKPIRARALLTRIEKFLTKQQEKTTPPLSTNKLQFNELIIDKQSMAVQYHEKVINVSTNEFDLLWILASRAGQTVPRTELIAQMRGFDYDGFDRSVDMKISRLRKKLGDDSSPPARIKTVRGKGYLFVSDAW
jgi:DNA-binding response OmpR family regulator